MLRVTAVAAAENGVALNQAKGDQASQNRPLAQNTGGNGSPQPR